MNLVKVKFNYIKWLRIGLNVGYVYWIKVLVAKS